jgi:hypothetical protein
MKRRTRERNRSRQRERDRNRSKQGEREWNRLEGSHSPHLYVGGSRNECARAFGQEGSPVAAQARWMFVEVRYRVSI